jgi:arylformamidase
MILKLNDTEHIKTDEPIDLSIPIHNRENPVLAWYCEPIKLEAVMTDRFIGDVNKGGAVNFRNLLINPHAHGTHTECLGHISKEWYSINQCMKEFHFSALLISIKPQKILNKEYNVEDYIVTQELLDAALLNHSHQIEDAKALIIRTLPNSTSKCSTNYSNTNPTYFSKEAIERINELGIQHLIVDLPSIDREEDNGALIAHHKFWNYPENPQTNKFITELVFIPDSVPDGRYLSNIQITSLENDASPSKVVLFEIHKS